LYHLQKHHQIQEVEFPILQKEFYLSSRNRTIQKKIFEIVVGLQDRSNQKVIRDFVIDVLENTEDDDFFEPAMKFLSTIDSEGNLDYDFLLKYVFTNPFHQDNLSARLIWFNPVLRYLIEKEQLEEAFEKTKLFLEKVNVNSYSGVHAASKLTSKLKGSFKFLFYSLSDEKKYILLKMLPEVHEEFGLLLIDCIFQKIPLSKQIQEYLSNSLLQSTEISPRIRKVIKERMVLLTRIYGMEPWPEINQLIINF
ncbi:MAG: hypothetical protein AAFY71_24575, partial [Bacteroidota bacterium]